VSPKPVESSPSSPISDDVRTARNVPQGLKNMVCSRNNWMCYRCNNILPATFEIDHIVPSVDGGYDNRIENLQALCPNCHRIKTSAEFHQFHVAAARPAC
jgi:5-methylcytosine-specific restriction endonuclease McrA